MTGTLSTYIEKEHDPTYDQNAFNLPNWAEFFMDIYHYSTVKNIEDGDYTYPALYEALDKGLSRYTCSKIFPEEGEKKIHGAELSFYTISKTEKDVLLDEMIHAPGEVVNLEYMIKKTPFDASQLKDIADRWNIEIVKTDEGEKLDLAFLQEQIPRLE